MLGGDTDDLQEQAEEALKGKAITQATADEAAKAAVAKAKSLGHNAAKIHLARVAVKRSDMLLMLRLLLRPPLSEWPV